MCASIWTLPSPARVNRAPNRWREAEPRQEGAARLGAEFLSKIIVFWFWICRGAKYQNITKIPKCTWGWTYQNNGCIEADFYENFTIFQHFSRSFRKNERKLLTKTSEIVENLLTKFWKFWKIRCFLVFWCILTYWYFNNFCLQQYFSSNSEEASVWDDLRRQPCERLSHGSECFEKCKGSVCEVTCDRMRLQRK